MLFERGGAAFGFFVLPKWRDPLFGTFFYPPLSSSSPPRESLRAGPGGPPVSCQGTGDLFQKGEGEGAWGGFPKPIRGDELKKA